ncbi:MAG: GerMN domain-containing protein [Christensenellales bacterium]|jgi:spore germination protein GerM
MKRLLIIVVALCLLLCGCGVIRDNNEPGAFVSVSTLNMDEVAYPGRVEKRSVYFMNETSGTLTAEIRNLVIGQDTNPAEVAVEALLKGPSNKDLKSVAPYGMGLDFIEFSREVANVYLKYDGEAMQPEEQFILELALANTITDILGATSICIFYNGIQTGFAGLPSDPQQKQTGNIKEAWFRASAKYSLEVPVIPSTLEEDEQNTPALEGHETAKPQSSPISTVLYFISADGGFLLPEVRDVTYPKGNYIETLIEELKKGPQNKSIMKSPLTESLELLKDPVFKDAGAGRYRLSLNFSKLPTQYDFSDERDTYLSCAAIIYTIIGFVPGIESIDMHVMDNEIIVNDGSALKSLKRENYLGCIGSSVPVYFSDKNSDLLLQVSRSMEQEKTWSAKWRLMELLKGPLAGDGDNAWPVIPSGVTEQDILSVDVYEDTVYVNLSQSFKSACAGLSAKNEMLLVYAIVNTITAMDGISKVQFLVEGQQTEALAGYLCLSDPLLRNYGIIKQID